MKKLFVVCLFALCSLFALSAASKTYELTFSSDTKVGAAQLKPGEYTMKVVGEIAIFTLVENGKQFSTHVKVESVDKKFNDTHVNAARQGDVNVVKEIELGGEKQKLEFAD